MSAPSGGDPHPDLADEASFRRTFDATYQPLVAYARRRLTNPSEADDVVSETYVVAWRRRNQPAVGEAVLPWLYGIAGNVIRNRVRADRRRVRLLDRVGQSGGHPTVVAGADPAEHPGAGIRDALGNLSFEDQEVLRLVAWEGLSHAEAGVALGCSANAVGIRVHRARKRLEEQLR